VNGFPDIRNSIGGIMEILKQGKLTNGYFVGKCETCGCVVKLLKSELREKYFGDLINHEFYKTRNCPPIYDCETEGCETYVTCYPIESVEGQKILNEL
jgi:hypothetical protein